MTGKELVRILQKKGWLLDRIKGSHHILIKDDATLSVPVHGKKEIPAGLLHRLMKEGGLKE